MMMIRAGQGRAEQSQEANTAVVRAAAARQRTLKVETLQTDGDADSTGAGPGEKTARSRHMADSNAVPALVRDKAQSLRLCTSLWMDQDGSSTSLSSVP